MKKYLVLLPAMALALSACSMIKKPASDSMMDETAVVGDEVVMEETMATGDGVLVGGAMMVPSKNIVDNAAASKDHTTVVSAVQAAGLADTLKEPGPFTVFTPTNAAFAKLPAGTVESLLKPEKKADLTKILTYHVVPGRYTSADLKDGMKLKTVQGEDLTVTYKGDKWMVNGATITIPDVISSNGVTFVIDTVMMPMGR
jgi:uncharacterized surface protein with fasciclin (FAS1) repeats